MWFAGHQTSFRDMDKFDLSLSSLYAVITRVTKFLVSMMHEVIQLPSTEKKNNTKAFFQNTKGFPNVIGSYIVL